MTYLELLLFAFVFSIGFNIAMFIPAYIFKTDKLTDISYALAFAGLATFGFFIPSDKSPAALLAYVMVLVWAARIGSFLFIRIRRIKRDKRFDGMREVFTKFLGFWLLQGITVFIVLLAALNVWIDTPRDVNMLSYIGIAVFCFGLAVEAVADNQKAQFSKDPKNKGKWIATGLWSRSRHPNYFGEILVWIGMWMFSATVLTNVLTIIISFISPLFITFLLTRVSGIPLLEKSADERWGKDKAYREYKKQTPVLIPKL